MKKYLFSLLIALFTVAVPFVGSCSEKQNKVDEVLIQTEFMELNPLKSNRLSVNLFSKPVIRTSNNFEGVITMEDVLTQNYILKDGRAINKAGIRISVVPKILDNNQVSLKVDATYVKSYTKNNTELFEIGEPIGEVICEDGEPAFIGAPITGTTSIILIKLTPTVVK